MVGVLCGGEVDSVGGYPPAFKVVQPCEMNDALLYLHLLVTSLLSVAFGQDYLEEVWCLACHRWAPVVLFCLLELRCGEGELWCSRCPRDAQIFSGRDILVYLTDGEKYGCHENSSRRSKKRQCYCSAVSCHSCKWCACEAG